MPAFDLSTLPANAQQELLDFYEFLLEKYTTGNARRVVPSDIAETPPQKPSQAIDFKTLATNLKWDKPQLTHV